MRYEGPLEKSKTRTRWRLGLLVVLTLTLMTLVIFFQSNAAPVSVTIPYSSIPVADAELDGDPATGSWSDSLSAVIPLENGEAPPYGSSTLYAKHDGAYVYLRVDGKIDLPWTSATGNHFWLGMVVSPSSTSHHGGGTWDGVFFGLWDGTDYVPQPTYPPPPVDTNGFSRPPSKDSSQDAFGKMRYSGTGAPYSFTAEWKKKLNTGDAQDIAYAADGISSYNFFITTDSNGKGSLGGNIDHSVVTNTNSMKFAPVQVNTPPRVDLIAPNGGEDWSGGSSHYVRWNMSDAETAIALLKVWISYSTDSGLTYSPIPGAQGFSGCASNPCSFQWTLPSLNTLQARVNVTVVDQDGASASDYSLANFSIDSTAPTVTAFNPPDGSTGVSTSTQVRVSFSESMNQTSAEQAFSLKRLDTNGRVSGSFTWSSNDLIFTPSGALAEGIVYRAQVNATARDASDPGNLLGTTYTASFTTIDLTPPTISNVSAAPSPQEAGGWVSVSALVTDNGMVSGVWIEIYDPSGALMGNYTAAYDTSTGRYFYNASYVHPGTYGFGIKAEDGAGNRSTATGNFAIIDTTPPTIQHVPVTEAVVNSTIRITALVTDVDAVLDARVIYTDVLGTKYNMSMTLVGSLYELDIPGQSQMGTLTYYIWATDPSGNTARTPQYNVTIVSGDATPPTISNVKVIPSIQNAGFPMNISASVSDNVAVQNVTVQITDPQGLVLGNFNMTRMGATDTYYYERTYFALGNYSFILWAVDGSNNNASISGSFEIIDTLSPLFQWISVNPLTQEAGKQIAISANVTDNVAVSAVRVLIRDATASIVLDQAMSESSGLYWTNATFRTLGNFTFELTAQDSVGNANTYHGNFTIVDTQPPVALAGLDVEVWIGSVVALNGSSSYDNSAIVSFSWSTTYNGQEVVLYGPLTSFTFDLAGQYSVTLRVVDLAGLEGTSGLKVTVITDTTPPSAPENILIVSVAPACLKITWEPSTAADTSGYRVYRWNATRGSFDPITQLPADTASHIDCGLEEDTVYSYWVIALDQYGNQSPPSSIGNGRASTHLAAIDGPRLLYQAAIAILLTLGLILPTLWARVRKRGVPSHLRPT